MYWVRIFMDCVIISKAWEYYILNLFYLIRLVINIIANWQEILWFVMYHNWFIH